MLCFAAKIAVIVICAVSALIVVVLSAVYTKRAIDRRLASVGVQEEVQVEEQHYLLGSEEPSGFGGGLAVAPAGHDDSSTHRGVMVSVETPVLVRRSSSCGDASKLHSQHQQQLQQPLHTLTDAATGNWGLRVAQKLGFSAGSSGRQKLKASEDLEADATGAMHCDNATSSSTGNCSKSSCLSRTSR